MAILVDRVLVTDRAFVDATEFLDAATLTGNSIDRLLLKIADRVKAEDARRTTGVEEFKMSIFDFAIKFFFRHSQPERLTGGASDVIESRVADPISRNLDIIKERLPEYRQVADETETVLANVKKLVGDDSFGRYGYINHPALTPEARRELIEHRNRAISYSDRMATSIYPYKSAAENLKWHGYSSADLDVEIAATGELVHDTFERLYTVAHQLGGPPGLWYNGGVLGREVYDRCAPGMEAAFDDPHVAPL